jgi:ribosomal protein S18 acetylase RimI-like enzyme
VVIRRARASDAERLSRFAAASFRDAFGAQNTAGDMATYLATTFAPGIQAAEIAESDSDVLLVEPLVEPLGAGGLAELLGYAHLSLGAPPSPVEAPVPIELRRFYVARPLHGSGIAARLMDAVVNTSRARGARTLWLGVWEKNPRAIAFYAKHGFTIVGQQAFQLGRDRQSDRIMARPL